MGFCCALCFCFCDLFFNRKLQCRFRLSFVLDWRSVCLYFGVYFPDRNKSQKISHKVQVESCFLLYHFLFWISDTSVLLVVLVWVYTVLTTLITWPLTFVDTNYMITKIIFSARCTFLSTYYIRLCTFEILSHYVLIFLYDL